ncbi:4Fe-4S dicluster domain-containing protein [Candidatus Azobacteroides pseudotrichonymphae]|uniref:Heterodisulfide reductase subunit C n=1 Tax=Azobacteroides pseudotrichonymphae genomovar. CFP2 TaxID=511995 RepID=B6YQM9_AZOPC|nr:4Fe-4S dicluster domain-containing protein [Candidatus Azobacteroides pseudotrichonymphae]BAG83501.1 heterodisulfide reductase subunit C [Candidatus Azobacteroides pseudotrichonymphae genomovar. CFP2]
MNYKKILSTDILRYTGISIVRCYQCGKCSAGCPMSENMDFTPNVIMRMLQTEEKDTDEQILGSQSIWLCTSCEMCVSRCPMEINIPKIMDYLRQHSLKKGLQNKKAKRNIIPFHCSFLDSIKHTGRLNEIGLIMRYKIKTLNLLQDLDIAFRMLIKGKLPLLPEMVKKKKQLSTIFKETKK